MMKTSTLLAEAGGKDLIGRRATARLGRLLKTAHGEERFYTAESLIRKVSPTSIEALLFLLSVLVDKGVLRRIIRVESPKTGAGLEDFTKYETIPREIEDKTTGETILVGPENLRILFQPVRGH